MSKRGENIYKRKDGRWEGRYLKENKKYGYIYGKSYKDVKNRLNIAKVTLKNGNDKTKISVLCDKWLTYKSGYVKESSLAKYKSLTEKHIKPYFEKISVEKISEYAVREFANSLTQNGYSAKTVKIALSVLEGLLLYSGLKIDFSFKRFVPKSTKRETRILSENEQKSLESYLLHDNDPCKTGVLTALYTGIRIGELCALKWENISLAEGYIKITSTLQRIQQLDGTADEKTKIIITEPKTFASKRIIPLPDFIVERLRNVENKKSAYLLTGAEKFIEPRGLSYEFKKYLKECGIDDINFHALRHSFATRCVEADFEPKTLSEILGHSSVGTTLGIYTHPSLEYKRASMNRLAPSI